MIVTHSDVSSIVLASPDDEHRERFHFKSTSGWGSYVYNSFMGYREAYGNQ
jgi:hypothetical protein